MVEVRYCDRCRQRLPVEFLPNEPRACRNCGAPIEDGEPAAAKAPPAPQVASRGRPKSRPAGRTSSVRRPPAQPPDAPGRRTDARSLGGLSPAAVFGMAGAGGLLLAMFVVLAMTGGGPRGGPSESAPRAKGQPTGQAPVRQREGLLPPSGRAGAERRSSPGEEQGPREPVTGAAPLDRAGRASSTDGEDLFARLRRESAARMGTTAAGPPRREGATPLARSGGKAMSFQDGASPTPEYAGTADAYISESAPAANHGREETLLLDGDEPNRSGKDCAALLRWDVSAVPRGSKVLAATLTFDVANKTTDWYEVYEVKRDWAEGEVSWGCSSAGKSWEVPGASGPLDRGPEVLGRAGPRTIGVHSFDMAPQGIALVQSWVDAPPTNHGIVIANSTNTNGMDLKSRETASPGARPKLTVVYEPAGR